MPWDGLLLFLRVKSMKLTIQDYGVNALGWATPISTTKDSLSFQEYTVVSMPWDGLLLFLHYGKLCLFSSFWCQCPGMGYSYFY